MVKIHKEPSITSYFIKKLLPPISKLIKCYGLIYISTLDPSLKSPLILIMIIDAAATAIIIIIIMLFIRGIRRNSMTIRKTSSEQTREISSGEKNKQTNKKLFVSYRAHSKNTLYKRSLTNSDYYTINLKQGNYKTNPITV